MAAPTVETGGRCQRGLERAGLERVGDTQFVAGMGAQRIMCHQLLRDLDCKHWIEAAANIDRSQFLMLTLVVDTKLRTLLFQIGLLGVLLRMHRDVLARGHRHGAGDETGNAGDQHAAMGRVRRRDTQNQASCRQDAVIGTHHRRRAAIHSVRSGAVSAATSRVPWSSSGHVSVEQDLGDLDKSEVGCL